MLVKELIKELKKYPNDFTVQINNDKQGEYYYA